MYMYLRDLRARREAAARETNRRPVERDHLACGAGRSVKVHVNVKAMAPRASQSLNPTPILSNLKAMLIIGRSIVHEIWARG